MNAQPDTRSLSGVVASALHAPHARPLLTVAALVAALSPLRAIRTSDDLLDDLVALRDRCLCFAAGVVPGNPAIAVVRHGLWPQSPFSPAGEIDLAASGFALAALPSAVECGVLPFEQARDLAAAAAAQVASMVRRSATSSLPSDIACYGLSGMLFHYSSWDAAAGEFRGNPGTEVSSIDTALLLFGLMTSAGYFGGDVQAGFDAALANIDWRAWLDTSTPDHANQFRMAYYPGRGFSGWWDWYTHETMLICTLAAMALPDLDVPAIWNAWRRQVVDYPPDAPEGERFHYVATWNGDPFTVTYGLHFLPLDRLPADLNGVDWFEQGRGAFAAHTEYFRREHGYRDGLVHSFFCQAYGAIAEPKCSPDPVAPSNLALVHALAGGLMYYSPNVAENPVAQTLVALARGTTGFYSWTGWPVAAVVATDPAHPVASERIVGQDILATGLAIDNYLTRRPQEFALRNARFQTALARIFPRQ